MTVTPRSASPLSSSTSLVQGHETLPHVLTSLPSQQHSRLNTTFASTATPSAIAATGLATTLYAAPTHLAAAGVLALTTPGTTHVPPLHATRRVPLAHTPRLSVSHALALTKYTLPSAPTVLPLSPVRRVGRMMRCTSTGGFFPQPSYLLLVVVIPTLLPAREALFVLRLVMPCSTGVAPLLSLHRGFRTSLYPHGLLPISYDSLVFLVQLRWIPVVSATWVFCTALP